MKIELIMDYIIMPDFDDEIMFLDGPTSKRIYIKKMSFFSFNKNNKCSICEYTKFIDLAVYIYSPLDLLSMIIVRQKLLYFDGTKTLFHFSNADWNIVNNRVLLPIKNFKHCFENELELIFNYSAHKKWITSAMPEILISSLIDIIYEYIELPQFGFEIEISHYSV